MDLQGAKDYLLNRLRTELKPTLYYHDVGHTLDVCDAANRLIRMEGITGTQALCIETAALYHDSGMIRQYINHEEASVEIARETLPGFGYGADCITEISRLIMVTKLPQGPQDLSQKVLCDADLDYLGRDDFLIHAFKLRVEWLVNNIKPTTLREWFDIQIQFLGNHTYFTASALSLRNQKKKENLAEIQKFLM